MDHLYLCDACTTVLYQGKSEIEKLKDEVANLLEESLKQIDSLQQKVHLCAGYDKLQARVEQLEAALRNLVSAENAGESFEADDPNYSLVPVSTINMIDDAIDVAEKTLQSANPKTRFNWQAVMRRSIDEVKRLNGELDWCQRVNTYYAKLLSESGIVPDHHNVECVTDHDGPASDQTRE